MLHCHPIEVEVRKECTHAQERVWLHRDAKATGPGPCLLYSSAVLTES